MPLARTLTGRSKSRSPIPPKVKGRAFLPPAHYAAAAGISYDAQNLRDESDESTDGRTNRTLSESRVDTGIDHEGRFMPVSYKTSESDTTSLSSFEFNSSNHPWERPQYKRQSRIENLEALLIPSLKDTIDRMTRSPCPAEPPELSKLDIPKASNSRRSSHSNPTTPVARHVVFQGETAKLRTNPPLQPGVRLLERQTIPSLFPSGPSSGTGSLRTSRAAGQSSNQTHSSRVSRSATPICVQRPSEVSSDVVCESTKNILSKKVGTGDKSFPSSSIPRPQKKLNTQTHLSDDDSSSASSESRIRCNNRDIDTEIIPASSERNVEQRQHHVRFEPHQKSSRFGSSSRPVGLGLNLDHASSNPTRNVKLSPIPAQRSQFPEQPRKKNFHHLHDSPQPKTTFSNHIGARNLIEEAALDADLDRAYQRQRAALLGIVSGLKSEFNCEEGPAPEMSEEDEYGDSMEDAAIAVGSFRNRVPSKGVQPDSEDEVLRDRRSKLLQSTQHEAEKNLSGLPTFLVSTDDEVCRSSSRQATSAKATPRVPQISSSRAPPPPPSPSLSSSRHSPSLGERNKRVSRSPIVSTTDPPPLPAALRKHSVYHRAPSPHIGVLSLTGKQEDRDVRVTRQEQADLFKIQPPGSYGLENANICAGPRKQSSFRSPNMSAYRPKHREEQESQEHREISWQNRVTNDSGVTGTCQVNDSVLKTPQPPSGIANKCYGVNNDQHQRRGSLKRVPSNESDLSSAGSVYWDDDDDSELSAGAESLFKELSKEARNEEKETQSRIRTPTSQSQRPQPPPRAQNGHGSRGNARKSPHSDDFSSMTLDQRPRNKREVDSTPTPAHHPSFTPAPSFPVMDSISTERRRLFLDFYNVQQESVNRMQVFVQIFILPLRIHGGRTWIIGVPPEVARLFDWFEDIVVLNKQILSIFPATQDTEDLSSFQVAEPLVALLPRFEVYQPYLVKIDHTIGLIRRWMHDEDENDFGEFLEMQESQPECEGWHVENFLAEPIERLLLLQEFFKRLLELTPKRHPDYLSTFTLVHGMDMVIRVLGEVKVREEEYGIIKKVAKQIQGLDPDVKLATRERRLLHKGVLYLLDVEDGLMTTRLSQYFQPGTLQLIQITSSSVPNSSEIADPSPSWDPGSPNSFWWGAPGGSGTESVSQSGTPTTPLSPFFPSYKSTMAQGRLNKPGTKTQIPKPSKNKNAKLELPESILKHGTRYTSQVLGNSFSIHDQDKDQGGLPGGLGWRRGSKEAAVVHVFVFNDLAIFVSVKPRLGSDAMDFSAGVPEVIDGDYRWTLLSHLGVSRILGVQDTMSYNSLLDGASSDGSFLLDILPVDTDKSSDLKSANSALDPPSVATLRLAIPPDMAPGKPLKGRSYPGSRSRCQTNDSPSINIAAQNHEKESISTYQRWMSCFQRCIQCTLCSISSPSAIASCSGQLAQPGHVSSQGVIPTSIRDVDLALDTYQTVFSLLASGLPLPKSPSVQLMVQQDGERGESDEEDEHGDPEKREREERGWWSVRFRQVMRELQRRDVTLGEAGVFDAETLY